MKKLSLYFVLLMILSSCTSLLYYPDKQKYYSPKQVQLQEEEINFKDSQGHNLHGWFFKSKQEKSKGTVIFFHGNAQNLSAHFVNLHWLPDAGYNYFIFDYPGFGESSGEPTPQSTVEAGSAAVRWILKNKDQRPLIIYGHSIGGIIALRTVLDLKNEVPFKAVIIDSSFDSYKKVAMSAASKTWITWLFQPFVYLSFSDEYAPKNLAQISPIPILFICGLSDSVIDPKFSQNMFEKSAEPKQIWKIPGSNHADTFWIEKGAYRNKLADYLAKIGTSF